MVQNKYEYIEFLLGTGLQDNSAYSYGQYLETISTHLDIVVGYSTVSSNDDVISIISQLSETDLAQSYKSKCGVALRRYLHFVSEVSPTYVSPDEIINPDQYTEGAKKKITVNSYERDTKARNKCIEVHGLNCSICNINFEEAYGNIGIGYIHVHHKKPLSEINHTYEVNPETDLIPVCPNCHAMLHRSKESISIETLKSMYNEKASDRVAKGP